MIDFRFPSFVKATLGGLALLLIVTALPACGDNGDGELQSDYHGTVYFEENDRFYSSALEIKLFSSGTARGSIERGAAICGFDGTYSREGDTLTLEVSKSRGKTCGWDAELSGTLSESDTRYEGHFTEQTTAALSGGFLLLLREESSQ